MLALFYAILRIPASRPTIAILPRAAVQMARVAARTSVAMVPRDAVPDATLEMLEEAKYVLKLADETFGIEEAYDALMDWYMSDKVADFGYIAETVSEVVTVISDVASDLLEDPGTLDTSVDALEAAAEGESTTLKRMATEEDATGSEPDTAGLAVEL